jgi:hypothetical protein
MKVAKKTIGCGSAPLAIKVLVVTACMITLLNLFRIDPTSTSNNEELLFIAPSDRAQQEDTVLSNNYTSDSNEMNVIAQMDAVATSNDKEKEVQQCRLDIEKWLNPKIDEALEAKDNRPPFLEWVWEMNGYYLVLLFHPYAAKETNVVFRKARWNWKDQFGNDYTGFVRKNMQKNPERIYVQLDLPAFSNGTSVPGSSVPVELWPSLIAPADNNETVETPIYDLQLMVKCDKLEKDNPPPSHVKLGACVRFQGQHELVAQWIEYHRLMGMQHFWLFLNEPFDIHDLPQANDITYVPYNFAWRDHANHSAIQPTSWGANFWQTTAQNQCLYRLKRYGLDWFTTLDLDEYIWINDELRSMERTDSPPLQKFLSKFEHQTNKDVGALEIRGWGFGRNKKLEPKNKTFELLVDYTYRVRKPVGGRNKCLYQAQVAEDIGVHWVYMGGRTISLNISEIRLNHYKRPRDGVFQARKSQLLADSSLPDKYRELILKGLEKYEKSSATPKE